MQDQYVIGLDFGTDSVRALLVNATNGEEIVSHVHHFTRWGNKRYCDPEDNQFRQHPLDHIEGMEATIVNVVRVSGIDPALIRGICIDTTGSSPVPVTQDGTPLAMVEEFKDDPDAMMVLWKDHTAIAEAEEINTLSRSWGGKDFTQYEGGIYSSEWFWAKILHIIRNNPGVREHAYSWLEHCDLMTYLLVGNKDLTKLKRSRCAAGHKAMWHGAWGGLPPKEFLTRLDPYLACLRDRLYTDTFTSDVPAGTLSAEWAERTGLTPATVVAVGTFDAHAGAVGARVEPGSLVRVMGTSTCDIMIASHEVIGDHTVRGICGQVDGSVIPGMIGLEAGQSAFGDVLAWFKDVLMWPVHELVLPSGLIREGHQQQFVRDIEDKIIPVLTAQAAQIPHTESIPVALDWINGRRTPDADQNLKSAVANLSLGTKAPHIFKSLVHAICFGSKKIVDRFEEEGVAIDRVIGIGGVARKSPYIMQTLANVLNRPIVVAASDYAPALGAAVYAAVAAGIYPGVIEASRKLGSAIEAEYQPQPAEVAILAEQMNGYDALSTFIKSFVKDQL